MYVWRHHKMEIGCAVQKYKVTLLNATLFSYFYLLYTE